MTNKQNQAMVGVKHLSTSKINLNNEHIGGFNRLLTTLCFLFNKKAFRYAIRRGEIRK